MGYVFIFILLLSFLANLISLITASAFLWLMPVLFTSAALSIFFLSLDHYQKTAKDQRARRAFSIMIALSLVFISFAIIEWIAIL